MRIPKILKRRISVASPDPERIMSRLVNKVFHLIYPRLSLATRLRYQGELMGGSAGDDWALMYDKVSHKLPPPSGSVTIGSLDFNEASPLMSEVMAWMSCHEDSTVIQVGASSGREIATIAQQFPSCRAIYSDIDATIVAGARKRYGTLVNLEFTVLMAHEIGSHLSSLTGSTSILVISSGSLQYVHPEQIGHFFEAISNGPPIIDLALVEPGRASIAETQLANPSTYRGGFSFTHDYGHYARVNGLHSESWKVIRPYLPESDFGRRATTIHLYGWFKNYQ